MIIFNLFSKKLKNFISLKLNFYVYKYINI